MPLEIATFPKDLNPSNPTFADPASEGYQHLNLVKGVIKATFPNLNSAVTAKPADLNNPVLATTRPAPVTQLGGVQTQTIPYYDSPTTASTLPVTDFGKMLLNLSDASALGQKLNLTNYVLKAGDTMTGPLSVTGLTVSGNGVLIPAGPAPTISFGPRCQMVWSDSQARLEIYIDGSLYASIGSDFKVRNDVIMKAFG